MPNLKLRDVKEHTIPTGPSFSSGDKINFTFDTTHISFTTPKHSSSYKSRKPVYNQNRIFFRSRYLESFHIEDSWKSASLFFRSWAFNGPWFSGTLAELSMDVFIITPSKINSNVSFFHPRAFENTIADFLTNEFSKIKRLGRSIWKAPMNWQPISKLPINAVRLNVLPDEYTNANSNYLEFIFIPISNDHIIVIEFVPNQLLNMSLEKKDKLIDRSTMIELMDNIINSIEITLSPEAKTQQEKAIEDIDSTSLIKEFPPMKWSTPEQDAEWETYSKQQATLGHEA